MRGALLLLGCWLCLVACDAAASGAPLPGPDVQPVRWSPEGATGSGPGLTAPMVLAAGLYRVSWTVPPDCTLEGSVWVFDWALFPSAAFGAQPGSGWAPIHLDGERYNLRVSAQCAWRVNLTRVP